MYFVTYECNAGFLRFNLIDPIYRNRALFWLFGFWKALISGRVCMQPNRIKNEKKKKGKSFYVSGDEEQVEYETSVMLFSKFYVLFRYLSVRRYKFCGCLFLGRKALC